MKKVIRLAAAVLVALALIASCALAEETASVMIPQGEGSYAEIPAASIQNTAGEKFYWIDMTKLTAEQLAALPGGVLEVFNEEGDLLAEAPFVDTAVGADARYSGRRICRRDPGHAAVCHLRARRRAVDAGGDGRLFGERRFFCGYDGNR